MAVDGLIVVKIMAIISYMLLEHWLELSHYLVWDGAICLES